jgi:hypothetical protein
VRPPGPVRTERSHRITLQKGDDEVPDDDEVPNDEEGIVEVPDVDDDGAVEGDGEVRPVALPGVVVTEAGDVTPVAAAGAEGDTLADGPTEGVGDDGSSGMVCTTGGAGAAVGVAGAVLMSTFGVFASMACPTEVVLRPVEGT